ncbi:hypothetical protein K8T06_08855, partial [bacterium]|nr:hypothetical protein [bacterium]
VKNIKAGTDQKKIIDAESEFNFRKELSRAGISHTGLSLTEIETQARTLGWKNTTTLSEEIGKSDSLSNLANRRSELQEIIRKQEKIIIRNEPMLKTVLESIKVGEKRKGNRKIFAGLIIVGSLSAVGCLYMNFQANDSRLWYPLLLLSTAFTAFGMFGFRQNHKKSQVASVVMNQLSARAELSRKLKNSQTLLETAQTELDSMESKLGSKNLSDTKKSISNLIDLLQMNDNNINQ